MLLYLDLAAHLSSEDNEPYLASSGNSKRAFCFDKIFLCFLRGSQQTERSDNQDGMRSREVAGVERFWYGTIRASYGTGGEQLLLLGRSF